MHGWFNLKKIIAILIFSAAVSGFSQLFAGDLDDLYLFWLVKPRFDDVSNFNEGLAAVKINGKWGFINKKGKVIIEPQFENPISYRIGFHEGLAAVRRDKKWGFIDKKGNVIVDFKYDGYLDFNKGIACVMTKGFFGGKSWIYIDKKGNQIIDDDFESAAPFRNGIAAVKKDGCFRFIDIKGNYLFEQGFDDAMDFSEGLAPVKIGDKYGYIDVNGKIVIEPRYSKANVFYNGTAFVKLGNEFININRKGREVQYIPERIIYPRGIRVYCSNRCGYKNRQGILVIGKMFEEAHEFKDGAARVKMNGKWGFITLP